MASHDKDCEKPCCRRAATLSIRELLELAADKAIDAGLEPDAVLVPALRQAYAQQSLARLELSIPEPRQPRRKARKL